MYVTEYGYETNPPDQLRGVTLEQQATYLSEATYLAWRHPEVRMFAPVPPPGHRPRRVGARALAAALGGLPDRPDHARRPAEALAQRVQAAVLGGARGDRRRDRGAGGLRPGATRERPAARWRSRCSRRMAPGWPRPPCPSATRRPTRTARALRPTPRASSTASYSLRDGGHTLRAVWQRLDAPAVISQPVRVTTERAPGRIGSLLRPRGLGRAGPAPDGHAKRQQARADQGQQPGVGARCRPASGPSSASAAASSPEPELSPPELEATTVTLAFMNGCGVQM